jgi:hypothetical protein
MSHGTPASLVTGVSFVLLSMAAAAQAPPPADVPPSRASPVVMMSGAFRSVSSAQGWLAWNVRFQSFRPSLRDHGYLVTVVSRPDCFPAVLMFSSGGDCTFKRRHEELTRSGSGPLCGSEVAKDSASDTTQTEDVIDFRHVTGVETTPSAEDKDVVIVRFVRITVRETVRVVRPDHSETVERSSIPDMVKLASSQLPRYLAAVATVRESLQTRGGGFG